LLIYINSLVTPGQLRLLLDSGSNQATELLATCEEKIRKRNMRLKPGDQQLAEDDETKGRFFLLKHLQMS
jgi:translation initiation factor IF-1